MSKLIGTNPNQVPSNADLGSAAFMNKDEFLLSKGSNLSAIHKIVPKSAVNVFVYDTTKDSDGGAWRKNTQGTSWYNEALNTTTRGSRREFPSVAVFVLEATKLTIYDGDDPNMPMWMVFKAVSGNMIGGSAQLKQVVAMNGTIVVGAIGYAMEIRFISDRGLDWFANQLYFYRGNIEERNATKLFVLQDSYGLANQEVSAVAMAVFPGSKIDQESGLPKPVIAVGNLGGISLIYDERTVVRINATSQSNYQIRFLNFDVKDNKLIVGFSNNNSESFGTVLVLPVHETNPVDRTYEYQFENYGFYSWITGVNVADTTLPISDSSAFFARHGVIKDSQQYSIATNQGLLQINHVDDGYRSGSGSTVGTTNGAFVWTTHDYTTGWLVGDIKVATLAETNAETIPSYEYVFDPNLDSTNGWFFNGSGVSVGSGWSISGGSASHDGTGGDIYAEIELEAGVTYSMVLQIDLTANAGPLNNISWGFRLVGNNGYGNEYSIQTSLTAGQVNYSTQTWTPETSGTYLARMYSDEVLNIDFFSVRRAVPDRTVYSNDLRIVGQFEKTPVAAGAELVSYSGFDNNTANIKRLYEPTVSFGSPSTICMMGWQRTTDINDYQYICSVYDNSSGQAIGLSTFITGSGNDGQPYFYDNPNGSLISDRRVDDGQWHFCVGVLDATTNPGTTAKYLYVDGELTASSASVSAVTASNVSNFNIGHYSSTGTAVQYSHRGDIALVRISASAPTADMVRQIYEQEKELFKPGAKCTLFGSVDEVRGIGYDERTKLLHAGTYSGRSVFDGLRRIDNTEDNVSFSISASNGLVAED